MESRQFFRVHAACVAVWSMVIVGCSSDSDFETATSTTAVVDVELAGFPALEPAVAQESLASLDEPVLSEWIQGAEESVEADSSPCDPDDTLMSVGTFQAAAALADPITRDLLLNLDAALGAAAHWCSEGDGAQADTEFSDAKTIAVQFAARVEEMQP